MRRQLLRIVAGHGKRMAHRPGSRRALRRLGQDPDPLARRLADRLEAVARRGWVPEDAACFEAVEAVRAAYLHGSEDTLVELRSIIGVLATTASKRPRWARTLHAITAASGAEKALEYGTCIGISAAYIAWGLRPGARLFTIESKASYLEQARRTLEAVGVADRVVLVEGRFQEAAPPLLAEEGPFGLIFKDAEHLGRSTVASFEDALPHLADGALFVFDDITWSKDMNQAWNEIRRHPKAAFAVDLFNMGLVCVRHGRDAPGPCYHIALP